MPQIEVDGLSMQYRVPVRPAGRLGALRGVVRRQVRTVDALRDVNFSIEAGEMVGYIGPNGAGKSTTVKALSGILTPTGGQVSVLGRTPWHQRREHVAHIGVMFGQRTQLMWDLPVRDSFDLLQHIYRVEPDRYRQRLERLTDMLAISGTLLSQPVRQLSLGQRQRCDIAAALLHSPSILFLDEPTLGLDAPSRLALRAFLKELNREEGLTVLLTTHDMDDIAALTGRVIFIAQGRLLFDGGFGELKRTAGAQRQLVLEDGAFPHCPLPAGAAWSDDDLPTVRFDPEQLSAGALLEALGHYGSPGQFRVEEGSVDEIIARLYARAAGGEA